jgi:hypothetical protein
MWMAVRYGRRDQSVWRRLVVVVDDMLSAVDGNESDGKCFLLTCII